MASQQPFYSPLFTLSDTLNIDRIVTAFNDWLGTNRGFIHATLATLIWIPFVAFGYDKHGFIYLYMATALSLISNFSLAIYARKLQREQDKFEYWLEQMLKNQADTMKAMMILLKEHDVSDN